MRMERQTNRPHARPKAYGQTMRQRGTESEGQIQGQMDRPHAGPKAHGQTEKERRTETEGQTQGQRQTDVMQDPRQMDKETEGDRPRDRDRPHARPKAYGQRDRGGQKKRDRHRDSGRQTDLMQDPRQRASQFQTLVDVEDQVGFIVETMLSLVVIVPEEQLVHLGQTSHVLDPINPFSSRLHITLNITGTHLRVEACELDLLPV